MQHSDFARHLVDVNTPISAVDVERVSRNRRADFDAVFLAARASLVGLCRSIVGDDAEDVVHDAYLIGQSRLDQLREPERGAAWLTKIAVNLCYERHRRRERLQRLLPFLRSTVASSDVDLRAAIDALPSSERTIVVLHYGYGLGLGEIATLLDRNPATVRNLMFRARGRLRKRLAVADALDQG